MVDSEKRTAKGNPQEPSSDGLHMVHSEKIKATGNHEEVSSHGARVASRGARHVSLTGGYAAMSTPQVGQPFSHSRIESLARPPLSPSKSSAYEAVRNSGLAELYKIQEMEKPLAYDGLSSTLLFGTRREDCLDVCVKIVEKKSCVDKEELQRARAELDIHKGISQHRNIVSCLAAEETADAFLLVTPFTPAGDLWGFMKHGQTVCEIEVRNCAAQILEALCEIHSLGLIHGDVKPHNILLFQKEGRFVAKLCDFGLTQKATLEDGMIPFTGLRGTSGWYAPEQIERMSYSSSIDVWGVGIIAFRMLGGYEPFFPATRFCEPLDIDETYFGHISAPCLDLVQQLLKLNPEQRATSSSAAKHIWFTGDPPQEPTQEMLKNLGKYGALPTTDFRFWNPDDLPKVLADVPASNFNHISSKSVSSCKEDVGVDEQITPKLVGA